MGRPEFFTAIFESVQNRGIKKAKSVCSSFLEGRETDRIMSEVRSVIILIASLEVFFSMIRCILVELKTSFVCKLEKACSKAPSNLYKLNWEQVYLYTTVKR